MDGDGTEPQVKLFNLRLSKDMHTALSREAEANGVSLHTYIMDLIRWGRKLHRAQLLSEKALIQEVLANG